MNKLAGMLHISRKAGKILLGRTAVLCRAGADKSLFILAAGDSGTDIMRKLDGLDVMKTDITSSELGEIFGRGKLSLIGITDESLAAGIRDLIKSQSRGSSDAAGQI